MLLRMNVKCGKTRAYTSGKPRPHGMPHDTTPINCLGVVRVVNGPPESPLHAPMLRGFVVQRVFAWTLRPKRSKRRIQF